MKRLLFFISGLIFLLVAGYAQGLQHIHGLVTDPDMKAVAGMKISLFSNGKYDLRSETDSNGYFSIHTSDTGSVKLSFRKEGYSFYSPVFSLDTNARLLLNVRYKGRLEITMRDAGETIHETVTEVQLLKQLPERIIIYHEPPRNALYPETVQHRSAQMILQNWQFSAGENMSINFAPLNTSR